MTIEDMRKYVLALDGAYYANAVERYHAASRFEVEYDRWKDIIRAGNDQMAEIESRYSSVMDAYDELEPFCTKIDRDWQSFEPIAKSFIQTAASIHLLCVACLEAHINIRADQTLSGKLFGEFDKLSITGKWLFYPIIISVGSFDPGKEPFQGFQQLVSRRNALAHYKTQTRKRRYGYEVPDFVETLGLGTSFLTQSLKAVTGMVKMLAEMEQREAPGWVIGEWWAIFDF